MTMRTFASDVRPHPARCEDWEGCHDFACRILADRRQNDPQALARGRFTDAQVADRERIAKALVTLWGRVVNGRTLPDEPDCLRELGASLAELRVEVRSLRERTRHALTKNRDEATQANADTAEALWWHLQPIAHGSMSHIWIAHEYAMYQRTQRRGQQAA